MSRPNRITKIQASEMTDGTCAAQLGLTCFQHDSRRGIRRDRRRRVGLHFRFLQFGFQLERASAGPNWV
jgi:hypothetical protein